MIYQNKECNRACLKKQQGATLVTVLVFLVIMTGLGVSASKIAVQDIMIAGNDQLQVDAYQETSNQLKKLTSVIELYVPLTGQGGAEFNDTTGVYKFPLNTADPHNDRQISRLERFPCNGFSGRPVSIGPDQAECDLFDFYVRRRMPDSSITERHNRGAAKEVPNISRNSYLN